MTEFDLHDVVSAPEGSRPILQAAEDQYGMVPNLLAQLAASPAALESYLSLGKFFSMTSLTPTERMVVRLTVSCASGSGYSMAACTGMALIERVDPGIIDTLRAGGSLPDPRLEALQRFTRLVVEERGKVGDRGLEAFLDAGFSTEIVFEVLVGVSQELLSNYVNHLADTPVDKPFRRFIWERAECPSGQ